MACPPNSRDAGQIPTWACAGREANARLGDFVVFRRDETPIAHLLPPEKHHETKTATSQEVAVRWLAVAVAESGATLNWSG